MPISFGELQNIANAMLAAVAHIAAAERKAFDGGGKSARFHRAGALPPGDDGKECRTVAGLRRQRKIVAFAEPQHQRERFAEARVLRERDDLCKIGIARQNSFGSGKDQRVDRGVRECPLHAANKRRGEKYVAQPA